MLNVSTGIEPFFALKYKRRTVSLNGDKDVTYDVELPIVEEFKLHTAFAEAHKDALITAEEIQWTDRIHMQAALQTHIDTAISSTINLPESITAEEIEQLYLYAWKKGLKGVTIFRNGSQKPILSTADDTIEIVTKRPESLNAKVIRFKNKSEDWIAVIGMMNDKPYEIFTGKVNLDDFPLPKYIEDGQIIKVRNEEEKRYDFQYTDKYNYVNRLGGLSRIFNQEYWNYAKLISALLRGGTSVDKVIKIVNGLDLDSDTLNTWKNGVIRALKKFVEDGTYAGSKCPECGDNLIYTAGCISCASCGYSKCG
jgi:ribonucleoside-diphosphate reductase alpha chain